MQNMTLYRLVMATLSLSVGHTLDHAIRGDFDPSKNPDAYSSILVTAIIYLVAGVGILLYQRRKIGPGAWLVVGAVGLLLAIVAHLLPSTAQPLSYIFAAYTAPVAGGMAVGVFLLLFAALLFTTIYAAFLVMHKSDR
jgi:hypothetical protein